MASPVKPFRRIRGKRAQARQHRRRDSHDLRERYRPEDLQGPDLAVIEFDDPYSAPGWINPEGTLDPNARLQQARGGLAEGAPEWVAPPRQRVRAPARLKEDPLGRMHARQQLDQAQYLGGREYQQLHDATQVALVRSVDLSKTKVSGGQRADPLTDKRQHASRKLHHADEALMYRYGAEGLSLIREVLCERRSVEQAGRLRGADSVRATLWFGGLFRKCLSVLAVQFGFASSTRRPPRQLRLNGDGIPDVADSSMHADAGDLKAPGLRSGRPNGRMNGA